MSTLRASRRQDLLKQLRALQYLFWQGIAIRGHTEVEGNLYAKQKQPGCKKVRGQSEATNISDQKL